MLGWPTIMLVSWAVLCAFAAWWWSRLKRWDEPRRPHIDDLFRLRAREARIRDALEASARNQLDAAHGDVPNLPEMKNG